MLAPSPAIQVLHKIKTLLADESRWCKGDDAVDASGRPVSPFGVVAKRFCLHGALLRVASGQSCFFPASRALNRAAHRKCSLSYVAINDSHSTTHADVLALIDDAIAIALDDSIDLEAPLYVSVDVSVDVSAPTGISFGPLAMPSWMISVPTDTTVA